MKQEAKVVIIGGGVVGCSALYHLAKRGLTDALLLERDELTSGSTWHAAGNCPTFAGNWNIMKYQSYGNRLYARLAEDVDYPMNYHVTGSIRLAHTEERMDEFRHAVGMAQSQGLDIHMMTVDEIKERMPQLETHDILGGMWDPYDGDIDPSQATQAFAKGARDLGAKIQRFTQVEAIKQLDDGKWHLTTRKRDGSNEAGEVIAEIVINAAGYFGAEVAAMIGEDLPMVSMSHQYLVTEPVEELIGHTEKLPLVRDVDVSYYLRQERDGLILGPYEWDATPMWTDGKIPQDFANQLWPDDLDRLEHYIEDAMARLPMLATAGIQRTINGPIPYTPDGLPYIGPAANQKNFYHCCGFSFGVAQGPGAGKTISEYIVDGEPEWDMWMLDPRRYTDYNNMIYTIDKACELYQNEYAIGFPYEERPAGRPAKASPVYGLLKGKGARFGARAGWERATYFPTNPDAEHPLSLRRKNQPYQADIAREAMAVRENVGILDLPGFAKFVVKGPDARSWLDKMVCGKLPKSDGRMSLAYMLNGRGGVLSEFTVNKIADDEYYLISAAGAEQHDEDWLRHNLNGEDLTITNQTDAVMSLIIAGPNSRKVLEKITTADLSNEAFPWLTSQTISIGRASIHAMRVNYVGELGWELHVRTEYAAGLYELLWAAGEEFGMVDFGMYAMDSLRLEKGYRAWKDDINHEYTPFMSSLDRFIDMNKADFIGKDALQKQLDEGIPERLVPLIVDDIGADAPYCAAVSTADEKDVGLVVSAGYGHALKQSIALAYIRTDLANEGQEFTIDIYGEQVKAVVGREPLYDHNNAKLRA